ncbi:MAG: hypothetical protein KF784_06710 [Fimbriimonadaceae bacterium]|nr:hypothetical protein [Fimbriimonadaceae bacterium]
MKTRASILVLIAALAMLLTCVAGSQGTLGDSPTKVVKTTDAPVTHREASTIIARMESVIRRVIHNSSVKGTSKIAADDQAVQRTELLKELNRLFEICRPKFKFTPDMTAYDPKEFTLGNDANIKAVAGKLVNWGAVGKVAPLVSGSKPTLTVAEFGDAVGFFLLRMSELTHTPSTKFSPAMMGDGS